MKNYKTVAIILAAGQGKRMNSKVKKQYLLIQEKPVIFYTLDIFQKSFIDEIILVVSPDEIEYCKKEIVEYYDFTKVISIIEGGKERYHSVAKGLDEIQNSDYIFIHDGARPFVTQDILKRVYEEVKKSKACVVGVQVKDTIKIVGENNCAVETPPREKLWMIQTPQVFESILIKNAYSQLIESEKQNRNSCKLITDDAMVVEKFGNTSIKLVEGSYKNIKITTQEDLEIGGLFAPK